MIDKVRVAVITPSMRPGGGPAGYVYNWREAVTRNPADFKHAYSFSGRSSSARTLELPSTLKEGSPAHRTLHMVNRLARGRVRTARDALATLGRHHSTTLREIDRAEVVVIQAFQSPHLARAARKLGKKVIYMPHSPTPTADERAMLADAQGRQLPAWEHSQLVTIEAELFRLADGVVFPSPGAAEMYRPTFAVREKVLRKVRYVASGVPDPAAGEHGAVPRNKPPAPVLAFAGRYVAHKGYDTFCRAAALARKADPSLQFVSLGAGPISPAEPVIDLGWRNDPYAVLQQVGCVVIANRVAYYDLLPLEIAGLGLPMVMTPVGGNVDQAAYLPDVLLSHGSRAEDISNAMLDAVDRLRRDPDFGKANRRTFEEHFTIDAFAARWDDAISSILTGKWENLG